MSAIFHPIPCPASETPRAWKEFLKIPFIATQCDLPYKIIHWRKLFVCLTTVALLTLGSWQIFRLCLLPPKLPKDDNKHFSMNEIVVLKYLKINFHDINLITKAVSLYSNLTLLQNVITENYDSLLNSIGFNVSMLIFRIILTFFGYGLGILKGDYGDLVREGSLYVILILHLIQLSCITQAFYKMCTFFV